MEEDDTIIIQVIFKFDDGRLYTFDVDRTTTFYEVKKILTNAAHILKNSFTLYHNGIEFSNEYDEQPLQKISPSLRKIEFYLKLIKLQEEQDENEKEHISVKYNIKEPCKEHIGKFLVLYCISCKKSICNECFSISHNNHEVEEKADYLMPAKILMERIFENSFMFKSDPKLSNYMSCVSFRSIIKTDVFDRMRQLINELENKCINCLEFFSFNEDSTEKNNDLNLELLKKYCTSSFIKLKNNIDTKDILINDEVFLSLYNKLKAIKDYEIALFTENSNKYKVLNQFFLPFTQEIKDMAMDLNNILTRYINKDIYAKFKEDISKNIVDVVQKEDVIRFMFENVNAPKSSLIRPEEACNKSSHTPNIPRLLPSILLMNEAKGNNITSMNNKVNMSVAAGMTTINLNNTSSKSNTGFNQTSLVTPISQINKVNSSNLISSQINSINTMNKNNSERNMNQINSESTKNQINFGTTMSQTNSINSINQINKVSEMNSVSKANDGIHSISPVNPINSVNNNIQYQQFKENFTISSLIHYSKASNNAMTNKNLNLSNMSSNPNQNKANVPFMPRINDINMINEITSIEKNINSNLSNINNTNEIHSMNNINSLNIAKVSNITTTTQIQTINKINNTNSLSNNSDIMNNMGSFLFVKNITHNAHETNLNKEEKDKDKAKAEKGEKMEVEEANETPKTQSSPNIKPTEMNYAKKNIEEIKANLSQKNIYTSPIMKKAMINIHLSPSKKDDNFDNKSEIISNTYARQNNLTLQNDSKCKIEYTLKTPTANIKNTINNVSIFSGKLIDILNKEKNNNEFLEIKRENKEEKSLIEQNSNFANQSKFMQYNTNTSNTNNTESTTNVKEKYYSQSIENNCQANYNNLDTSKKNISFAFMYPVYKTNIIKGAIDKNSVQEIKINFSEFANEDPVINEFPNGGAYCNYENSLYFTGGQDYIKAAGKLFLSISKNILSQNAKKLPLMRYSHWNHSMIADKDKIYVIGGYNSKKCEIYDITSKTWSEMPDLNEKERQRCMLLVEKNFLYCFMGLSQSGILDSIERINIDNIDVGWESIIVENANEINLKFYGAGIIRMSQADKIYFIGGKKENKKKENIFKRSIYEFSFDSFKMTESDFKIENDLVFVENSLFSMDENDCGNFINIGNGYLISMPTLVK